MIIYNNNGLEKLKSVDVLAFDADDTLWHNEPLFNDTQIKFKQLLSKYHSEEWIESKLYETEIRNLKHFGYGVKGFTFSMVETAIELTEGRISGEEIQQIINFAKDMMSAPVHLIDGVQETLARLAPRYKMMLITKGDLFDQESKIARSGLSEYFNAVEIVSEKDKKTYLSIVQKHQIIPERFLMIGNSVKSDILPVLDIGGNAVHIPYELTWAHERVNSDEQKHLYLEVKRMTELVEIF